MNLTPKKLSYLLILIPLILTFYIRTLPLELNSLEKSAEASVHNFYRSRISEELQKQYPNIPSQQLGSLAEEQFQAFLSSNGPEVERQIENTYNSLRENFLYKENGNEAVLLGDLDSYYYLRQARNLVEKGTVCDEIEDGVCYDSYTIAPLKIPVSFNMHPYMILAVHKVLSFFNPGQLLMSSSFYTPFVFSILLIFPLFILMKKLSGNIAAVSTTLLVSAHPFFLSRSFGSDTDVYNVFFPIFAIWLVYEAFTAKKMSTTIIYSSLASVSMWLYSIFWTGWWYVFDFAIISILFAIAVRIIRNEYYKDYSRAFKDIMIRRYLVFFLILFFGTMVLVSITPGFKSTFLPFLTGPFAFTESKAAANSNVWPNVLTTVAEFNEVTIHDVISTARTFKFLGLDLKIYFFALLGLLVLVYGRLSNILKNKGYFLLSVFLYYLATTKLLSGQSIIIYLIFLSIPLIIGFYVMFKTSERLHIALFFLLWILSSIYASTVGSRFLLLLVVPISVGAGISLQFIYDFAYTLFNSVFRTDFAHRKRILKLAALLPIIILIVAPVKAGISTANSFAPSINAQWVEALQTINHDSQEDAIINSWWDFGHWFKFFADRRVTLDGASQNNPPLHWLGKILLTSDEEQAVAILRMIDCGSNTAYDKINSVLDNPPLSIELLNKIIMLPEQKASALLDDAGFSPEQIAEVLENTHCSPPEDYFITSEDMVAKSGVWGHFGSWNFYRAYLSRLYSSDPDNALSLFVSSTSYSEEQATALLDQLKTKKTDKSINSWIAPWPGYSGKNPRCNNDNNTLTCNVAGALLTVDLDNNKAYFVAKNSRSYPDILTYVFDGEYREVKYSKDLSGIGIILIKDGSSYVPITCSPEMANSLFTKLFFFNGAGTSHFSKIYDKTDVAGSTIKVWKVIW